MKNFIQSYLRFSKKDRLGAVVLVLLWLGGFFVLHVSSFLIHLLLIFALISIVMNFVGGRRAV